MDLKRVQITASVDGKVKQICFADPFCAGTHERDVNQNMICQTAKRAVFELGFLIVMNIYFHSFYGCLMNSSTLISHLQALNTLKCQFKSS